MLQSGALLADRLQQAMALAEHSRCLVAVCVLGLDRIKAVDDRLGFAAGDELLQMTGRRLEQSVRRSDTVARLDGDRFVLLLLHLRDRDACHQVLARVLADMAEPVELGSVSTGQVQASIGVAFFPDIGRDANHLLRLADDAMQLARQSVQRIEVAQPSAVRVRRHQVNRRST